MTKRAFIVKERRERGPWLCDYCDISAGSYTTSAVEVTHLLSFSRLLLKKER
jgi:hypothetical protein